MMTVLWKSQVKKTLYLFCFLAVKYSTVVGTIEKNVLDRYESNISKDFYFEIRKEKKNQLYLYIPLFCKII